MYQSETPLFQLTVSQFLELLKGNQITKKTETEKPTHYVYGIGGLASLLNCSNVTAQKLKNSGKVPYTQVGRKIIFDAYAVLEALGKKEGGVL